MCAMGHRRGVPRVLREENCRCCCVLFTGRRATLSQRRGSTCTRRGSAPRHLDALLSRDLEEAAEELPGVTVATLTVRAAFDFSRGV